jgi:GNAT superfamily N-acetyltransferase
MVWLPTRDRVDAYWCDTLAIDAAALHTPGVRVFPNPTDRHDWPGIYVLAFDKAVTIFTPPELVETVTGWLATGGDPRLPGTPLDVANALDPAVWAERFRPRWKVVHGPSVHHYRDSVDGLARRAAGRRVNPSDTSALAALRSAITTEEWTAAGFSATAAVLFGLFDDRGRILAAANLTPGPDAATDVSVVVHPAARGQGHGQRIAALAAMQAIEMHGVARFRALATSAPMLAIAAALEFEEYGRNLVVYLP